MLYCYRKELKQIAHPNGLQPGRRGNMKEDLKRIIDRLDEEDIYLLYVTALEMLRR